MGLSWRQRADRGHRVELPALNLGGAIYTLLPGEVYVEFQLAAQELRPDALVLTAG